MTQTNGSMSKYSMSKYIYPIIVFLLNSIHKIHSGENFTGLLTFTKTTILSGRVREIGFLEVTQKVQIRLCVVNLIIGKHP
jgi:hypothetical protein